MKLISLFLLFFSSISFAETFAVMTDLHFSYTSLGGKSGQDSLLKSVLAANPNAIILAGDSVSRGADSRDWVKYNETMAAIPTAIPVYSAIGNHETYDYSSITYNKMKPGYVKGFANFKNQFKLSSLYYSKDIGNVHFVFLQITDSNWNLTTTRDGTGGQYAWLMNDLNSEAAQKAKFIVVVSHQPMAPNKGFGNYLWSDGAYASYNKIHQLIKDKKVSLFIGGHTHSYKKIYNADSKAWYMIAGGPGAEGYVKLSTSDTQMKVEKFHGGKLTDTTLINARQ